MGIFKTAHMVSTLENPLTAHSAGRLFEMRLERHATAKERGAAAAARAPRRGRRTVAPFGAEGFGASTELGAEGLAGITKDRCGLQDVDHATSYKV